MPVFLDFLHITERYFKTIVTHDGFQLKRKKNNELPHSVVKDTEKGMSGGDKKRWDKVVMEKSLEHQRWVK